MENIALSVKNLTKVYSLYNKPIDRLKEAIFSFKSYHKDFYALDDINFDVKKGESLGIIGVNGSGKSTLLKIITGVLKETKGSVEVNGKIAALLELGAGFNMEYTGIENIFLNGSMMGFSKKEMQEKLDKIIEFADIGDFINRPVKQYSSGMFVRLAFALSIAVDPEILIVDEALSVGDIFFQSKCYKRMDELKEKGTTIIMVTHDLGAVIKYCDRTLVLNAGKQIAIGTPHDMVDTYKKILAGRFNVEDLSDDMKGNMALNQDANIYGDDKAEIIDYGIVDNKGQYTNVVLKGEEFIIKEKIKINKEINNPIFTFTIKDKRGTDLTGTNTMIEKIDTGIAKAGDTYEVEFRQKMILQGGEYLVSMSCTSFIGDKLEVHHRMYDILSLVVLENRNTVGIFDIESKVSVNKN